MFFYWPTSAVFLIIFFFFKSEVCPTFFTCVWFFETIKLPISVCFTLYLRNCRSHLQDFDNDIYRCFSLFLLKKCNIVNIKIILFFYWPTSAVFLIIFFFFKSEVCPTFFTCVWFFETIKLPISVCFTLYLRNCRSHLQDFDNDIYRCFSLFLLKKCDIVNIEIILFFIGPLHFT